MQNDCTRKRTGISTVGVGKEPTRKRKCVLWRFSFFFGGCFLSFRVLPLTQVYTGNGRFEHPRAPKDVQKRLRKERNPEVLSFRGRFPGNGREIFRLAWGLNEYTASRAHDVVRREILHSSSIIKIHQKQSQPQRFTYIH